MKCSDGDHEIPPAELRIRPLAKRCLLCSARRRRASNAAMKRNARRRPTANR